MTKSSHSKAGLISVIAFLIVAGAYLFYPGQDDKYGYLWEPRITNMPNQKVIQVTAVGDPATVSRQAFDVLFSVWSQVPGAMKSILNPYRARFPKDGKRWGSSVTGYYALPVPDKINSLREKTSKHDYKVELTTWEYGDVAEILHKGPYDKEELTLRILHQFLESKNYEIIGDREEEYVKGPGRFFKGNSEKYQTILRYRIRKKD